MTTTEIPRPAADREAKGLWWDEPWGLVRGCTPVSPACLNCWSAANAHRWKDRLPGRFGGLTVLRNGVPTFNGTARLMTTDLDKPSKRTKPTVYAVWDDLFHDLVSARFLGYVRDRMALSAQHLFMVLSKRAERMAPYSRIVVLTDNVALGTTVESQSYIGRLNELANCRTTLRFVSFEPVLGPIVLGPQQLENIGLAIIGCESGPRRRPCELDWIRSLVTQCRDANVPVWVKQLDIDGRVVRRLGEFPNDLRLRQWFTQENQNV